jgi:hypothetical protein
MDIYQTLDVYQASYLQHFGFQISMKENARGRIVFSAPLTQELETALTEYPTAFVPAREFANTIKELKRRMYTAKDNSEGKRLGKDAKRE